MHVFSARTRCRIVLVLSHARRSWLEAALGAAAFRCLPAVIAAHWRLPGAASAMALWVDPVRSLLHATVTSSGLGFTAVVRALLASGVDLISPPTCYAAISLAAAGGQVHTLRLLLEAGA